MENIGNINNFLKLVPLPPVAGRFPFEPKAHQPAAERREGLIGRSNLIFLILS